MKVDDSDSNFLSPLIDDEKELTSHFVGARAPMTSKAFIQLMCLPKKPRDGSSNVRANGLPG